jgi:hypothetical protein
MALYKAPGINFTSTTLNGGINNSVDTITLSSTTNLKSPGYIVIDRQDVNGVNTPTLREVVKYTAISGSDLTGCTRGADGSTNLSHLTGALVEPVLTVGMWNDQQDFLAVSLATIDGSLRPLSTASIVDLTVTSLSAVTISANVPLNPVFSFVGPLSGITASPQTALAMPNDGSFKWFSVMTRTVASGASAVIDINMNGTSIFDAGTRPVIIGGGTYVSTASIATKSFLSGGKLTWDYDSASYITDIVIQGRS